MNDWLKLAEKNKAAKESWDAYEQKIKGKDTKKIKESEEAVFGKESSVAKDKDLDDLEKGVTTTKKGKGRSKKASKELDYLVDLDDDYESSFEAERLRRAGVDVSTSAADEVKSQKSLKSDNAASKFKKDLGTVLVTDDDKLAIAKKVLSNPENYSKKIVESSQEMVNQIERNLRAAASANAKIGNTETDLEFSISHRKATQMFSHTQNGEVSGAGKSKRKVYQKKDPRAPRITNVSPEIRSKALDLAKHISNLVDIRAVLSTQLFEENQTKNKAGALGYALNSGGKDGMFRKVGTIVFHHRDMYENYVKSLGRFLTHPNLDPNSSSHNISVNFDKNLTARTAVAWQPLSKKTLELKAAGDPSGNTYWRNSGKLANAYKASARRHLRSIDNTDFYDSESVSRAIEKFRNTEVSIAQKADKESNVTRAGARYKSVNITFDLMIPKWRATHGSLMDNLITEPYVTGRYGKVSHHFKVNDDAAARFFEKTSHSATQIGASGDKVRDDRYIANKKIKEDRNNKLEDYESRLKTLRKRVKGSKQVSDATTKEIKDLEDQIAFIKYYNSDERVDAHIAPLTMRDVRNAFYEIKRVGSYTNAAGEKVGDMTEKGVRRFINPEFRRPMISRLSSAAGKVATQALRDYNEPAKNMT